jgi:hypothetical protein
MADVPGSGGTGDDETDDVTKRGSSIRATELPAPHLSALHNNLVAAGGFEPPTKAKTTKNRLISAG